MTTMPLVPGTRPVFLLESFGKARSSHQKRRITSCSRRSAARFYFLIIEADVTARLRKNTPSVSQAEVCFYA